MLHEGYRILHELIHEDTLVTEAGQRQRSENETLLGIEHVLTPNRPHTLTHISCTWFQEVPTFCITSVMEVVPHG